MEDKFLKIYSKWKNSRDKALLGLLECNPRAEVIDLGCGDGTFTQKIKLKIKCHNILGVEIHNPSIELAKNKINVIKHDLNKFPYPFKDNSFDVVVSNQVIEHLIYPIKFLKEIYRILKPGGYTIISTENLASWDNIGALVLGFTPFSMEFDSEVYKIGNPLSPRNKETKKDDYENPHLRIFTLKGLVESLEFIVGFKVEKVVGSGHIFGRIGEIFDKSHCRFITIKARKIKI